MNPRKENLPIVFPANVRHFVDHRSGGRSHWHEEIEIQYVVSGSAHPLCNLEALTLCEGDILVANSNELHTGNVAPIGNEFYCFHINRSFFTNSLGGEYIVFENLIRDSDCAAVLDKVVICCKKGDALSRIEAGKLLYEFFEILARRHAKNIMSEADFKKYFKREDKFNDIVKFIDDHIGEELTVKRVADKFFITESYLSHFFKKRSGKSVMQYVSEARIMKSKLYLEKYDMPIGEIAGLVGFDDINYFSRKFRQLCGETPTQYRSSCRE
ncbi:MAG: helix-turn-helix transcriptional regulator [Clostridia bacterium]|nr:helix-turn-helix transcriptional regulator [Clostridia bacterium]